MEAKYVKPTGMTGGRAVTYPFYFVEGVGVQYPSESAEMRRALKMVAVNQRPSWAWALEYLQENQNLWLVVELPEGDEATTAGFVRAAIWRTSARRGKRSLTSQRVDGHLWVKDTTYEK